MGCISWGSVLAHNAWDRREVGRDWPVVVSLASTEQWGEHFQNSLRGGGHGGPSLKCSWKALGWEVSLVQAPCRHPWLLTGHWEFVALEMVLGSFTRTDLHGIQMGHQAGASSPSHPRVQRAWVKVFRNSSAGGLPPSPVITLWGGGMGARGLTCSAGSTHATLAGRVWGE